MTSFKFLVITFVLLATAWMPDRAATDSDSSSDVTGTPGTSSTTHHRRHHTTTGTGTSSTNSTTASAGEGISASGKSAKSKTSKTSTASTKPDTTSTKATAGNKSTTSTSTHGSSSSTEATSESSTASSSTSASKKHKKHTTKSETAAGAKTSPETETKSNEGAKTTRTATTKTSTTPAESSPVSNPAAATNPASPGGAAAAAATVVNSQTAVATPGKGRHHRHGKTTPVLPEPPIVINTVNVPPLAPINPTPPLGLATPSSGAVPTVETSLPVPRPGAGTTASLPLALVRPPVTPVNTHFPFTDYASHVSTHNYPWKTNIVTTVFWIGEGSTPMSGATNHASAWDTEWEHHNGGADTGDIGDMSGYGSGSHASLINPFYVALPFNDMAYTDKAARWVPRSWEKTVHRGDKPASACQHRWVEIKSRSGRICYAQWEDVGPVVTDDVEYVFGNAPPSASRGLDVSPAVQKYLGLGETAVTQWRFVDDVDVPPGLWLRYDEQAILFQALKDQARRGTPIQSLSQPIPDGTDDAHSEKEIAPGGASAKEIAAHFPMSRHGGGFLSASDDPGKDQQRLRNLPRDHAGCALTATP